MRSMNSPLSTLHHDIDSIEKFVTAYTDASPSKKELLVAELKLTWMSSINAIQFGYLISHIEYPRISECYHSAIRANHSFLKDAEEFTQICAHLDPERITLLCELMAQRLHARNFIDNATAFSAIFSVFSVSFQDGSERQLQLNAQQLLTVYNILRPKLGTRGFFRTLDDFVKLFSLIPTTEDKVRIFEIMHDQLPGLLKANYDVNDIYQKLEPKNTIESELFKRAREKIFRTIINNRTQLNKAFHAMLFLILDNYPGKQPEKLRSIIEAAFSDSSTTQLNALLEKTESAMRFMEFNITSTRLRNAITHLIANLRTEEKTINVDHIIQLAKSKEPIVNVSFFTRHTEILTASAVQAATCQHEF